MHQRWRLAMPARMHAHAHCTPAEDDARILTVFHVTDIVASHPRRLSSAQQHIYAVALLLLVVNPFHRRMFFLQPKLRRELRWKKKTTNEWSEIKKNIENIVKTLAFAFIFVSSLSHGRRRPPHNAKHVAQCGKQIDDKTNTKQKKNNKTRDESRKNKAKHTHTVKRNILNMRPWQRRRWSLVGQCTVQWECARPEFDRRCRAARCTSHRIPLYNSSKLFHIVKKKSVCAREIYAKNRLDLHTFQRCVCLPLRLFSSFFLFSLKIINVFNYGLLLRPLAALHAQSRMCPLPRPIRRWGL